MKSRTCGAVLAGSLQVITAAAGPVLWLEGEGAATVPDGLERRASDHAPASGGKSLYGYALGRKDLSVTYAFDLPADLPDARLVVRYARLHWREGMTPSRIEARLQRAGAAADVVPLTFEDTRGWGARPADWRLLSAPLGPLKAGAHTLALVPVGDGGDVSVDGLWIAPAGFEIAEPELAGLIRLQIVSGGYAGLVGGSTVLDQEVASTLTVAVRSFDGLPGDVEAQLVRAGGNPVALECAEVRDGASPSRRESVFLLPEGTADGRYELRVRCAAPAVEFRAALRLAGGFLGSAEARLGELEGLAEQVRTGGGATAERVLPDLEHAIELVRSGLERVRSAAAAAAPDARAAHLAAQEGAVNVEPLIDRLAAALAQSEATRERLGEGQDPYTGRTGDLRRAYRSRASGERQVYRLFVPDGYAAAASSPFVLLLHGGGGDENYFPEMSEGAILRELNRRGYLAAAPRWHRRNNPNWIADAHQLIDLVAAEYPKVDPDRIYVTGISMGGGGTYLLATDRPERFAAAVCVSGSGDPAQAEALRGLPLMLLQGGSDTVVPPERAAAVAARLKELGAPHEFHLFPTHGHSYQTDPYLRLTLDFFDRHHGRNPRTRNGP